MQKTIKVEFSEQSKCVVASVKVESTGESLDTSDILKEAQLLFIEAHKFAVMQTMKTKIN
jgi:hypothetical protein